CFSIVTSPTLLSLRGSKLCESSSIRILRGLARAPRKVRHIRRLRSCLGGLCTRPGLKVLLKTRIQGALARRIRVFAITLRHRRLEGESQQRLQRASTVRIELI